MLKFILLSLYVIFAYANTATDICKKNFDDEINRETTMQQNLIQLIDFCKSKQSDVNTAFRQVSDYEQKIITITKHNLIKSTLKLGYEVFQEVSALNGVEGDMIEIAEWVKSKIEDYQMSQAKVALGFSTKDYYSVDLQILSDDLSKLTPELKKLNTMRTASLEAFKAKVLQETNQTVGDVGALYAKLRHLALQSEKAKLSLEILAKNLQNIIETSNSTLDQINNTIDAYKSAKDRTCKEQNDVVKPELNTTLPTVDLDINVTVTSKSCSSEEIEDIDAKIDNLTNQGNAIYKDLVDTFDKDFTMFSKSLNDKYKDFKNSHIYKTTYSEDDIFSEALISKCLIYGKNIQKTYQISKTYWKEITNLDKAYMDILTDIIKNYNDFYINAKTKYEDKFHKLKDIDINIEKLLKTCYPTVNYIPYTESAYKEFYNQISSSSRKNFVLELQIYSTYYQQDKVHLENVENLMEMARECVKKDENDMNIMLPYVKTFINDIKERDLAIGNLLDYMDNLAKEDMVDSSYNYQEDVYNLEAKFSVKKTENNYFAKLYKNFYGDAIDFMGYLSEISKKIDTNLLDLKSSWEEKKSIVDADYNQLEKLEAFSFCYRDSSPLKNIDGADEFCKLTNEAYKKLEKSVDFQENLTEFLDNIIGGRIPNIYYYPYPFKSILYSISDMWQLYCIKLQESFQNNLLQYKQTLNSARNFEHRLGRVIDIETLNFLDDMQNIIDGNITSLKNFAEVNLPTSEAKEYDLTHSNLNCIDALITLSTDKDSLTIFGDSVASFDINISSCDNREIIFNADLNQSIEDVKLIKSNTKISLQSLNGYRGDLNLILKAQDDYGKKKIKIIPIHFIPVFKNISIKKGWNLINGGFDASKINNKDINVVWSYDNGNWKVNSPYRSITKQLDKLDMLQNIKKLYFIPQKSGVWVYANKDTNLKIDDSTTDNIVAQKLGWSLLGSNSSISSPEEITCKDATMEILWIYPNDSIKWKLYYKDHIDEIESIEPNRGFWIYCSKSHR